MAPARTAPALVVRTLAGQLERQAVAVNIFD
jgi:hypothetical protein